MFIVKIVFLWEDRRHGFGCACERSEQKEAVESLHKGWDVFSALPIGFGKSQIFQLFVLPQIRASISPNAALVECPTITVICPLKSKQHRSSFDTTVNKNRRNSVHDCWLLTFSAPCRNCSRQSNGIWNLKSQGFDTLANLKCGWSFQGIFDTLVSLFKLPVRTNLLYES